MKKYYDPDHHHFAEPEDLPLFRCADAASAAPDGEEWEAQVIRLAHDLLDAGGAVRPSQLRAAAEDLGLVPHHPNRWGVGVGEAPCGGLGAHDGRGDQHHVDSQRIERIRLEAAVIAFARDFERPSGPLLDRDPGEALRVAPRPHDGCAPLRGSRAARVEGRRAGPHAASLRRARSTRVSGRARRDRDPCVLAPDRSAAQALAPSRRAGVQRGPTPTTRSRPWRTARQGILVSDDGQYARVVVEKWFAAQGEAARVEVEVRPLGAGGLTWQ